LGFRAKQTRYLPTVLTKEEVLAIIQQLSGVYQLVIKLLYGTGLSMIYTHVLNRGGRGVRSPLDP
jgi:integrase